MSNEAEPIRETIERWHQVLALRDMDKLRSLLDSNVVFHSPVMHTPQEGPVITARYLEAAAEVIANETFRYVRELASGRDAILEFNCEIDGIHVNGVDMIRCGADGKILEFKVMIRPEKALEVVKMEMFKALTR